MRAEALFSAQKMSSAQLFSSDQKREVIERTGRYLQIAEQLFEQSFPAIPILFDLKGKTSGMYQVRGRHRCIRYNPWIFAKYYEESLANTVPHEVAHYVTDRLYGLGRIRPHGAEWQHAMRAFGAEPSRTTTYDFDDIPSRTYRRFAYQCGCREHQITATRHNRVQKKRISYLCRYCGGTLDWTGKELSPS